MGIDGWVPPGSGQPDAVTDERLRDRPGAPLPPPPPPPSPPEPPRPVPRRGRLGLIITTTFAIGALGAAGVIVVTSADRDKPPETADGGARGEGPTTTGTASPETTSADRVPADVGTGEPLTAPDGSFAITLPTGWAAGFVDPALPPVEEQIYPTNPTRIDQVGDVVDALATPQTRMFALNRPQLAAEIGFAIPDLLQVDGMPGTAADDIDADRAIELLKQTTLSDTTVVTGEGELDAASGSVGWVAFDMPGNPVSGVRYLVTGGGWAWLVTFWSRSMPSARPTGDAMVAGMVPVPATPT